MRRFTRVCYPRNMGSCRGRGYDRLRRKRQYSTQSDRYTEIGDQQADSIKSLSPDYLQTMSLGSAMKWNNPMSRVFSIAMNGDEAVLSGGSSADMASGSARKRVNGCPLLIIVRNYPNG